MCKRKHKGSGLFCPACLRIKRLVRKIPKKQRQRIKKFARDQGVAFKRLLA